MSIATALLPAARRLVPFPRSRRDAMPGSSADADRELRIVIVTDAWMPQTNGVVRTLTSLRQELTELGHQVTMIVPDDFTNFPLPTYREIHLALVSASTVGKAIAQAEADAVHIATEGPLGLAARRYCLRSGLAFTTSFHTKFPDYIAARTGIPPRWTYALLRRFHGLAAATMVATQSVHSELEGFGFRNLKRWTRGVDLTNFRPMPKLPSDMARPIYLSVGRLAVEKNLTAFLDLDLPGTKLVVGDGPLRPELERRYPQARFVGKQTGEALSAYYAMADVFVFPSRTDTFGLVVLEALASGLPVAAYPVPGPLDIIADSDAGILSEDLREAALGCLNIDPAICRERAGEFTWRRSAEQFLDNLALVR